MVSNRLRYVSESTSDDETGDVDYLPKYQQNKPTRKPTRTPKCFSKNALMARENRLKKKIYITSLESQVTSLKVENKKMSQTIDSQTNTINQLKREVRYLKSIIANSDGIGKLLKAINSSTGMHVTTSLNRTGKQNNMKMEKSEALTKETSFNSNFNGSRHPWEDTDVSQPYINIPTPESTHSYYESAEIQELNDESLLLNLDIIPYELDNELLEMIDEKALESPIIPAVNDIESQSTNKQEDNDSGGLCLHVSGNKDT
ncbi:hypothetical protein ABEB36_000077 [Hypothenemus hampei]|uniref:BZIP domain-containing protein n=1 Tax=Hypothenemus hampei TaxID=57062 RepID=A0ABD1FC14_HYPHA